MMMSKRALPNPPPPSPASFSTPGSIPPPPSVPPHSSGPTGWPTTKAPSLIDDTIDACKGWGENEDFQNTEMALEGEPFVLGGCPFQSL